MLSLGLKCCDLFLSKFFCTTGLASVASRRLERSGMVGSHFTPGAPPGADILVADALSLPYRPASCDAALCIAVLHHLSSVGRRLKLFEQMILLLKPGGRAIVRSSTIRTECRLLLASLQAGPDQVLIMSICCASIAVPQHSGHSILLMLSQEAAFVWFLSGLAFSFHSHSLKDGSDGALDAVLTGHCMGYRARGAGENCQEVDSHTRFLWARGSYCFPFATGFSRYQ
jgi:hypothetical protein